MSDSLSSLSPFHLAFPVTNLDLVRKFYVSVLMCEVGRESEHWIDFDFFGHQITAHLDKSNQAHMGCNTVDSQSIPARHFGVILPSSDWEELVERVRLYKIKFYIEPYTRFVGEPGEQKTFFIQDPSENFLEFKCFRNRELIFSTTKK